MSFESTPLVIGEERLFPPKRSANGERLRVESSLDTSLNWLLSRTSVFTISAIVRIVVHDDCQASRPGLDAPAGQVRVATISIIKHPTA